MVQIMLGLCGLSMRLSVLAALPGFPSMRPYEWLLLLAWKILCGLSLA